MQDIQQQAVSNHIDGNALVIAGAGSGKTETLVSRTINLIKNGIDSKNILILTFTKAAALSLKNRVRKKVENCNLVSGTFHGIALKIIKENTESFNLNSNFLIIDPDDFEKIIKEIMADENKEQLPSASGLSRIISYSKNTGKNINDTTFYLYPNNKYDIELIEKIDKAYSKYKIENDMLDYDDLLYYLSIACEDENFSKYLANLYPYIMVDEYQDTNYIQSKIIYGLSKYTKSIMVVGDPSQSIYGFRGSMPQIMIDFKNMLNPKVYYIETNYRSSDKIVKLSNKVDESLKNRFERICKSVKTTGVNPELITVKDVYDEAKILVDDIIKYKNDGIDYNDQAVIFRSTRYSRIIENELVVRKIPYKMVGGIKLHETAHIKDFISIFRCYHNIKDHLSWSRFLGLFLTPAKVKKVLTLIKTINKTSLLKDLLSYNNTNNIYTPIINFMNNISTNTWEEFIETVNKQMSDILSKKYNEEWSYRSKDIIPIIELAYNYDSLSVFINEFCLEISFDKNTNSSKNVDDILTLTTVHSSKGLEWENVYIPSFIQGHIPSTFNSSDESIEEEKRLLYVALTRAKNNLKIYKPITVTNKSNNNLSDASSFEYIIRSSLTHINKIEKDETPIKIKSFFNR